MAFCSKCGEQINDGAKFCPKCGQPTNPTSQQQVYQQQYVEQPQEEEHSFMYKMWHSKWNWIVSIAIVVIFIVVRIGGCSNTTEMLQKEVKDMMIEKTSESGQTMRITDLTLVHQSGNIYTGIAKCTIDGERMDLDVNVTYDGNNIQAEWAPTAEYQYKVLQEGLEQLFDN